MKTTYPKVMCTQHPDSASKYISMPEEHEEALEAAVVFGCDECMPDYEGKATPYHQNVKIISKFMEETDFVSGKDILSPHGLRVHSRKIDSDSSWSRCPLPKPITVTLQIRISRQSMNSCIQ